MCVFDFHFSLTLQAVCSNTRAIRKGPSSSIMTVMIIGEIIYFWSKLISTDARRRSVGEEQCTRRVTQSMSKFQECIIMKETTVIFVYGNWEKLWMRRLWLIWPLHFLTSSQQFAERKQYIYLFLFLYCCDSATNPGIIVKACSDFDFWWLVSLFYLRSHPLAAEEVDPQKERKRMRRLRRKVLPEIPASYLEAEEKLLNDDNIRKLFGISDPLPGEEEGEIFFQKGLHGPHGSTLVFASPHMLQNCLSKTSKAKLDATFKILPRHPHGRQLLTIHASHGVNVSYAQSAYPAWLHYSSLFCFTIYVFSFCRRFQYYMQSCKVRKKLRTFNCSNISNWNFVLCGSQVLHMRLFLGLAV